jgi:hypothetical protein
MKSTNVSYLFMFSHMSIIHGKFVWTGTFEKQFFDMPSISYTITIFQLLHYDVSYFGRFVYSSWKIIHLSYGVSYVLLYSFKYIYIYIIISI